MNNKVYKKGDVAYYRTPFGVRIIKIIDVKESRSIDKYGYFEVYCEYLIQFKTGRRKIVKGDKLF